MQWNTGRHFFGPTEAISSQQRHSLCAGFVAPEKSRFAWSSCFPRHLHWIDLTCLFGAGVCSIMADFDAIVDLEKVQYDRGFEDAVNEALNDPDYKDGQRQGFLKGFAIGFEAGFLSNVANSMTQESSKDKDAESAASERIRRKAEEMGNKARSIPKFNDPDVDFDQEIHSLRSLYKLVGSGYGPCPPKLESEVTQTHEW